ERRRRRERRPESELHKRRPRLRAGLWTERVAFLLAFTLAGINVLLARTFRRVLKVEQERDSGPRPRAMRRRGTFEQVLGPQQDPAIAASPGRAPPWAARAGSPDADLRPRPASPCPPLEIAS